MQSPQSTSFQLESIRHEDEDLAKDSTSDTNYLSQVAELVTTVFQKDDDSAHSTLLEKLATSQGFIQQNAHSYRTQQQLAELFYDLLLLLARRKPINQLDSDQSAVLFTSCQYQFDLTRLIEHINQNQGVFINPLSKQMFDKRDRQLIKVAADACKLSIISESQRSF